MTTLTDTLNDLKQRGADDPASLRYMALEAENSQLRHENASLRQENDRFRDQLADAVRRSTPPKAPISPVDEYGVSRDTYKRRKRSADDPYLASASVSLSSSLSFAISLSLGLHLMPMMLHPRFLFSFIHFRPVEGLLDPSFYI